MSEAMITVAGLAKTYSRARVGTADSSLREMLVTAATRPWRLFGRRLHDHSQDVEALLPLSFTVGRGEKLGIIGRNGSGKSTLLKILTRISPPTAGQAELCGRAAAILEVGTGFHPDLTGHENIFLNGAILGLRRAFINERLQQIIDFSELADYLDLPVKRYSSGMYVRLAFAVAACLESDILFVDEVLAVGDEGFRDKCLHRMETDAAGGRTIVFVSHEMDLVERFCDRLLVLDHGRLVHDGDVATGIAHYHKLNHPDGDTDA